MHVLERDRAAAQPHRDRSVRFLNVQVLEHDHVAAHHYSCTQYQAAGTVDLAFAESWSTAHDGTS